MSKSALKYIQNKKAFFLFSVVLGILLVSASIFVSVHIAKNQAILKEASRLQVITNSVLDRMRSTHDQFVYFTNKNSQVPASEACSAANVRKMQEEDVSAFSIQAIGHVTGNTIDCSSLEIFNGMNLGEPYRVDKDGNRVWASLENRQINSYPYAVMERNGYVAILVPQHTIEALGSPEVAVGIFNVDHHVIFTSRGKINQQWIADYHGDKPKTIIDHANNFIVYIAPNTTNMLAVVTAIPMSELSDDIKDFAVIFIPLGMLIAVGLTLGFIYIAKNQSSYRSELLVALARNQFFLEYQPIIDLKTKSCVGAEALIRWRSPHDGLVRPDLFIPLAEESGLICQITHKVFELVENDMGETLRNNPHFHIGINVSAADLQSDHLILTIQNLIKNTGILSHQIIIEATETGLLNDGNALTLLKQIRDLGIQVAVDDFGTGYSSLSYLTKFELDYLKIDKTFVDAVDTDAVTGQVAFHIIEMAKSLNLEMVAEGVETERQAQVLIEHGVRYVQGWLYSKSLSAKDFIIYLQNNAKHP